MGTYILVLLQEEKRLNPKVSICVPTYNRADSLRRCLASLIALTYPNVEIIVGDNNSTDHTQQIISQFPTVKYIQETRQGLSFVRNSLLAACSDDSKYVGFIDDDESRAPTWVQDMMQGFSDPSVAVAGGPYRNVYLGVLPDWIPEYIYPRSFQERSEIVITNVFPGIPGGNALCRLDAIRKKCVSFDTLLGRTPKRSLSGEDNKFFQQVTEPVYTYAFVYHAWVYHYIPEERLTFRYIVHLNFWDSVSEYCHRKHAFIYWGKNLFKLFVHSISVIFSLFTFNRKYIVNRYLKLVRNVGYLYGPLFKILQGSR